RGLLEALEQGIGGALLEVVGRIDHDRPARAERRAGGQPLLHRADPVDRNIALALVRLALVALLLVVGGCRERFEHDDIWMIALRWRDAGLGHQLAGGGECERRLADPALAGKNPAVMHSRAVDRRAPGAPRVVVAG